jgi:hypothetical protein
MDFYKIFQLVTINFFILFILKRQGGLSLFFIFVINFLYLTLCAYYNQTAVELDFPYLHRNTGQLYFYLTHEIPTLTIAVIIACVVSFFIFCLYRCVDKKPFKKFSSKINLAELAIFLIFLTTISAQNYKYDNRLVYFLKSISNHDSVIKYYEKKYQENIDNQLNNEVLLINQENYPPYLDNIIILHLESINALLVNATNTPNLLAIADEGIYFDNFYSNSIQTIGAYENILCSLPTSFNNNLVNNGQDNKIFCLPKIFNELGYTTRIFKGGARLKKTKADKFFYDLGFSELHNDDIMQIDDKLFTWGYRENIFYTRTLEYLANKTKGKNFTYIDVGTTNHFPFNTPTEYLRSVPYLQPNNFSEKLSNTIYLQDKFLGEAWKKINILFPNKNYTIIILSDNSWPIGQHGNLFNEAGAYEENFRIPLVLIIGNQEKYRKIIIHERFSQLDIVPSLLKALGVKTKNNYGWSNFSSSFWPESSENEKEPTDKKIILIQPYSKKYINIIVGQTKYQYNSQDKKIIKFDLSIDSLENNPTQITDNEKESLTFIQQFFE